LEDRLNISHGGNLFAICRERGWDWREVLDLSASINPLGPPQGVRPAVESALERIAFYPEQEPEILEAALGEAWGVSGEFVLAGNGATELVHFVSRSGWQGPVSLVTPVWSEMYRAFPHAAKVDLAEPETWPQRGLLVVGQPVNPTGEAVPEEQLRRSIAGREGPVLLDESFIEFTRLESAVKWCESHPNLLVLRTLSKFHALPGLRVGAVVGSGEWMKRLRRKREPWQVSAMAEAAAKAAVTDKPHAERTRELIETERQWLLEQLSELDGLRFAPGVANFLFAETDRPGTEICAWFLENKKIILRNCSGLPGVSGQAVRFAVRSRAENERFVEAAKEFFCAES
jgi:threonine-phosphate decarboxylase